MSDSESAPPLSEDALAALLELLDTPAPSGSEARAGAVWNRRARRFTDDVRTDALGASYATFGDPDHAERPHIALVGHLDEIGLIVSRIDDKGFLRCLNVGGWDIAVLIGQRVRIDGTPSGSVIHGAIARTAVHVLDADARGKVPKLDELWIDIGATSRDEACAMVQIGDPAVIDVTPKLIGPPGSHRLMSRSLDNRVGCFVVLEAARLAAQQGARATITAVGCVGEEIGMGGSTAAIFGLQPDYAVAVDVTSPGDTPGGSDIGDLHLGKGPILTRGATTNARVMRALIGAAQRAGLPHQLRGKGIRTGTDVDQIVKAGGKHATGLVSVPARYLHTPVEQVDLRDVRASIDVLVAWIQEVANQ